LERINYLIKSATIIDPKSSFNGQKRDVLISGNEIISIKKRVSIKEPHIEIKSKNLHISPGFLDLHTRIGEPGLEFKEDFNSGLKAAAQGGFTGIVHMPNTIPPIQNSSDIRSTIKKTEKNIVDVFPTGCLTKNTEGKEITEIYDMIKSGAVAFTDDKKSIENAIVMNIAMEYSKQFNTVIMSTCYDTNLCREGQINEGKFSTLLGMKGIPEIAEYIKIARDIELTKYSNGKIHISTVSTKKSFDLIKQAKKQGINISCDISAHQLILSDDMLTDFNTNLKIFPPARGKKRIKEIIKQIKEGNIDVISSDHTPVEIEKKKCSFNNADFGIIGLETTFSICNSILKNHISLEKIIELLSINPRKILNIAYPTIELNKIANITIFDPDQKWTYLEKNIKSKSKNSPFINQEFTGKIIGILNKGKIYLNN
tara:strand:+ start:3295 stop:4575 length:1281 start_codon:yes stop_codon:yes gene_type:complete